VFFWDEFLATPQLAVGVYSLSVPNLKKKKNFKFGGGDGGVTSNTYVFGGGGKTPIYKEK